MRPILWALLERVTTRASSRSCIGGSRRRREREMPQQVGPELQLEAVAGLAPGRGHHAGVVDQQVHAAPRRREASRRSSSRRRGSQGPGPRARRSRRAPRPRCPLAAARPCRCPGRRAPRWRRGGRARVRSRGRGRCSRPSRPPCDPSGRGSARLSSGAHGRSFRGPRIAGAAASGSRPRGPGPAAGIQQARADRGAAVRGRPNSQVGVTYKREICVLRCRLIPWEAPLPPCGGPRARGRSGPLLNMRSPCSERAGAAGAPERSIVSSASRRPGCRMRSHPVGLHVIVHCG